MGEKFLILFINNTFQLMVSVFMSLAFLLLEHLNLYFTVLFFKFINEFLNCFKFNRYSKKLPKKSIIILLSKQ